MRRAGLSVRTRPRKRGAGACTPLPSAPPGPPLILCGPCTQRTQERGTRHAGCAGPRSVRCVLYVRDARPAHPAHPQRLASAASAASAAGAGVPTRRRAQLAGPCPHWVRWLAARWNGVSSDGPWACASSRRAAAGAQRGASVCTCLGPEPPGGPRPRALPPVHPRRARTTHAIRTQARSTQRNTQHATQQRPDPRPTRRSRS